MFTKIIDIVLGRTEDIVLEPAEDITTTAILLLIGLTWNIIMLYLVLSVI